MAYDSRGEITAHLNLITWHQIMAGYLTFSEINRVYLMKYYAEKIWETATLFSYLHFE